MDNLPIINSTGIIAFNVQGHRPLWGRKRKKLANSFHVANITNIPLKLEVIQRDFSLSCTMINFFQIKKLMRL